MIIHEIRCSAPDKENERIDVLVSSINGKGANAKEQSTFYKQAMSLGFEADLIAHHERAATAGDGMARLWVRLCTHLQDVITIAPPPHEGNPHLALCGPAPARLAMKRHLAALLGPSCLDIARVNPGIIHWATQAGRRLLVDMGEQPCLEKTAGLVRLGLISDGTCDLRILRDCDAVAIFGCNSQPGKVIDMLQRAGKPLVYCAHRVGGRVEAARYAHLWKWILLALARRAFTTVMAR